MNDIDLQALQAVVVHGQPEAIATSGVLLLLVQFTEENLGHLVERSRRVQALVIANIVVAGTKNPLERLHVVDHEEFVLGLKTERGSLFAGENELEDVFVQL